MIRIKPNANMQYDDAKKFLLDFLRLPNDPLQSLSEETLQKVVDAVLSIKKSQEHNNSYDRISSVDIVDRDEGDISLSASEMGLAKNDRMYLSKDHLWQDAFRFSLVSLLFHESTHNMQYFKLSDEAEIISPLKPEPKSPANLYGFQREVFNFVHHKNNGQGLSSIAHMFESDYYGQARELEAYGSQYQYMNEILTDLSPMMNDLDSALTYESYQRLHGEYFSDYATRHQKNGKKWAVAREIVSKFMQDKLEKISQLQGNLKDEYFKNLYANEITNVIAGLHFDYDRDVLKAIVPHIYEMPEDSFDDMSNKAMIINSLFTSTAFEYSHQMLSTLADLFKRLSVHPDNGKVIDGRKNINYSMQKFYQDYCYMGKKQLDMAVNKETIM